MSKKPETLPVTDHAIVRYLERVKGVDIDGLRAEILDPKHLQSIKFMRSSRGKIKTKGYTLVIQNQAVVTVVK